MIGMGGPLMRAQGLECIMDAEKMAVVGIVEVLKRMPFFLKLLNQAVESMRNEKVDLFVPIDFPDFNLRLCKRIQHLNLKIAYYICPQVWAWRSGRIPLIEKNIDLLLTIFPFEARYFSPLRLRVMYVGHPLLDEVNAIATRRYPERGQGKLCILPGSRHSEIRQHLPIIAPFVKTICHTYPELQIQIPCAHTLNPESIRTGLGDLALPLLESGQLRILPPGQSSEALKWSDAALIASGTSTLQGVLCNSPLALFYRLNPLTYAIGKRLAKVKYVGLANLIAEKLVCSEILQDNLTSSHLQAEAERLLWDTAYRSTLYDNFDTIRHKLGGKGASDRAALALANLLKPS